MTKQLEPIFVKLPAVKRLVGVSTINTLKNMMDKNGFPRPLKINGICYWRYEEIKEWAQMQINASKEPQSANDGETLH